MLDKLRRSSVAGNAQAQGHRSHVVDGMQVTQLVTTDLSLSVLVAGSLLVMVYLLGEVAVVRYLSVKLWQNFAFGYSCSSERVLPS